jgi:hypothetical protein
MRRQRWQGPGDRAGWTARLVWWCLTLRFGSPAQSPAYG